MKHQWEPTDSQGHVIKCTQCGECISIYEQPNENGIYRYDEIVDADNCLGQRK